ncbi:MAG: transcription antitermination factor NusB, partial [Verrucomicrobiota bacterium]
MSARRCSLEALQAWEETSSYADDLLNELAKRFQLSGPDRALAQELFYGVIRNLFLLDALIDSLRQGKLQSSARNLLRIGFYQIFETKIATHAAVNETVKLARQREKGLVNAILRNALRRETELREAMETWPLEDRYSHTDFLIERWQDQFGEADTLSLLEWNNRPPEIYARLNPLAPDEDALNRVRSEVQPCLLGDRFPDFFRFEGAPNREWLEKGLIYIQDPSTSLACRLLDPRPGEAILDACAAPGGKAALIAAGMNHEGELCATDSSERRLKQLKENLDRLGVADAKVIELDWSDPDISL